MIAPSPKSAPVRGRDVFLAVVADDVCAELLSRVAIERGWGEDRVLRGALPDLAHALAGMPTPRLLVVDLSGSADPVADVEGLSEVCDPGTRVIALGRINDIDLYRRLTGLGIGDYLLKPISGQLLGAAIDRALAEPVAAAAQPQRGRLIAVIGGRGGVGASTIAVNSAWYLAEARDRKVALVDLDLFFGTAALALDLEPGRGFREALENPGRIDSLFIERAMVRAGERLFVLGSEEDPARALVAEAGGVELLLDKLRTGFDCVVLDLPRWLVPQSADLLAQAAEVVVVADLSLAAMRDTLRLRDVVRRMAPEAALSVVANRVGLLGKAEMSVAEFEKGAEVTLCERIPFDPKGVAECANLGRAVSRAAGSCKAAKALENLAKRLDPATGAPVPSPFWKRLLGRKEA